MLSEVAVMNCPACHLRMWPVCKCNQAHQAVRSLARHLKLFDLIADYTLKDDNKSATDRINELAEQIEQLYGAA